ncbi:endonuclease/exonuclease/phosphatase family protein [Gordonia sp. NB41Y]|uniref:endonuclease/exonuclease/phosphatase family protein n=1 Tax=Gordonia sp. NB41Y TaxID=875808 RepID=UPI0006B15666|nr:endonuclease/exonuclease/phosphatase family protein [Gordonia sp. NB41Y]EMP11581.2 endonuclease [Gordonia sp. NB41Y]WLP90327.1 endonuclease/exonuclease/phosphatase family protein [Gordonia sp. NB41Y]
MRGFLTFVVLALGWVLLAVSVVAVWLHYHSSRGTVALYATAAVPYALVAAAVALIVFAVTRRWVALSLTVVAAAALCFTQGPMWVAQSAPAGERFTVASANLMVGNGDVDAVADAVGGADLVSLQEVTPAAADRIRASALATRLPHEYLIAGNGATGTMLRSRQPLTDTSRIPNMALANLSATTALPGAPETRVLAVHPGAPLQGYANVWNTDMQILAEYLAALPEGPAIVAGDFNATWDHTRFRALLTDGFADAGVQSGSAWVPTYPTDRWGGYPLVAIDHVVIRGFVATGVRTFTIPGSDHRGVLADLVAG